MEVILRYIVLNTYWAEFPAHVDTVTQVVSTFPLPVFSYYPLQASGCEAFTTSFYDSSVVAGGTIVNWLWNFGDGNFAFSQNPIHTYDSAGTYYASVTITSSYGCQMSDTLNFPIVVYLKPIAEFTATPDQTNIYDPLIQFNNLSQGATLWDWDLGDTETSILENPSHEYADTGTYMVTQVAINQYGCSDTASHSIRIDGVTTTFIPNAFTPNGNGLNDVFAPKLFGVLEFKMLIYDRWGNQIFSTQNMNEGWNGRVKGVGELVQQDVYVYKIFTKDLLHNDHSYIGSVTVVR
jgi:gliding motility-associated-like protein